MNQAALKSHTEPTPRETPRRRVIDAATRAFHWLFAACFLGAYITADGERWRDIHIMLGYTLPCLLVFRIIWGMFGPRRFRFSSMASRLNGLKPWLSSFKQGVFTVKWSQGLNLLMIVLVVTLLMMPIPVTLTGYLNDHDIATYITEELHEFFGELFMIVVIAHLAAVILSSVVKRKNFAASMITGYINEPGPHLAKHNHLLVAIGLLGITAYGWFWWMF